MRERKDFEMTKKQKSGKAKDTLWRVLISAVGAALIVLSLSRTALYFFGETAPASFSARRVGGADDGKPPVSDMNGCQLTFTDKKQAAQSVPTPAVIRRSDRDRWRISRAPSSVL